MGTTLLKPRQRELIRLLWNRGPLSRWELHEKSGQTPNGVGAAVGNLLKIGVLREGPAGRSNGGRPRVPLEIDDHQRHVAGLLIAPGTVEICRLNLHGNRIGSIDRRQVTRSQRIIPIAARMLADMVSSETLAVGASASGLIDPKTHAILLSGVLRGHRPLSLKPVYTAAGRRPLVVVNDMQALALRWMLTHKAEVDDDVLLVGFGDGNVGAAMLINGRPNRGCIMAANELGHTRMPVETDLCHCGQRGCLERICSSDFLHRRGIPGQIKLLEALTDHGRSPAVKEMIGLLGMGIANGVNFVRPHRLVLVGELIRHRKFCTALLQHIRRMMLPELAERVRIDLWDQSAYRSAETAGWAALADLYANPL